MLFTRLIFGTEKVYGRGELVRSCAALAASARTGNHQPIKVEGFVLQLRDCSAQAPVGASTASSQSMGLISSCTSLLVQPKIYYDLGTFYTQKID